MIAVRGGFHISIATTVPTSFFLLKRSSTIKRRQIQLLYFLERGHELDIRNELIDLVLENEKMVEDDFTLVSIATQPS